MSESPPEDLPESLPAAGGRARYRRAGLIRAEMEQSYLDYAMSVIIGRALPDVRDGLKPGQRRVLYAMFREKLLPARSHSKCAGIVGEVLKKYHPHGDASVYDTLVRLAQPFNLRHPLIDGKGNFGSVDGDPPAAYRYTEARLTRFAVSMMEDIDRNTVEFAPNFDGKTVEPEVLPTVIPNLLINGSDGIAVGMATRIPPHNLAEVGAALIAVLDSPDASDVELTARLLELVPGPDFPTGGRIHGRAGIVSAYRTGRGVIQVRAVADFETTKEGRNLIVVNEIPYQVNKARLIEKIADLVKDKRLTGISDLRDESDRRGMRVVIELRRGEEPQIVLNNLYRHTAMQTSYGMNLLAISHSRPKLFPLLDLLREFLQFRRLVVRRRVRFELERCERQMHLLEGLAAAVDRLDEVIEWIRTSKNPAEARERLMTRLKPRRFEIDSELLRRSSNGRDAAAPSPDADPEGLSEEQAQAILDMRLQRLTQLERDRIAGEMEELGARIVELREILADPGRIDEIVRDETREAVEKHGDPRRTEIVEAADDLTIAELIPVEDIVVSMTQAGYIKRTALSEYRAQARGGTGHSGAGIRSGDAIRNVLLGNTHTRILFLTDDGRAYRLKGYEIPEGGKAGTGRAIVNLLHLAADRQVVAVVSLPDDAESDEGLHLLTVTRKGQVKRTPFSLYRNVRATGLRAVRINEGDALLAATLTGGDGEVVLVTRNGKAIRFREAVVRPSGRFSAGVRGIRLLGDDEVVSLYAPSASEGDAGAESEGAANGGGGRLLLTVTRNGFGKMSSLERYPVRNHRGGQGVINIKTTDETGVTVASVGVRRGEQVLAITAGGKAVRIPVEDFRDLGRLSRGVRLIKVRDGDEVVAVTRIPVTDTEDSPDETADAAAPTAETVEVREEREEGND